LTQNYTASTIIAFKTLEGHPQPFTIQSQKDRETALLLLYFKDYLEDFRETLSLTTLPKLSQTILALLQASEDPSLDPGLIHILAKTLKKLQYEL